MKTFLMLLVSLFIIGCGYESVCVETGKPFVVGSIHQSDDGNVIFVAKDFQNEKNLGKRARVVLPYDYGYSVGDTLKIVPKKEKGE